MFLFHSYPIPNNIVSLQSFEVMKALWIDSTNAYFCAFILKVVLEMFMLHFLTASDLRKRRDLSLPVFEAWGFLYSSGVDEFLFHISLASLAFSLSLLLLSSWKFL